MLIERLACDTRFDNAGEVLGIHSEHLVHVAEIDRHAAERRISMAFKRGSGSEGDDRNVMTGTDAYDPLHLFGTVRKQHRIGRLARDPGVRVTVLFPHGLRCDQPVAEGGELRKGLLDGDRVGAAFIGDGFSQGHAALLSQSNWTFSG